MIPESWVSCATMRSRTRELDLKAPEVKLLLDAHIKKAAVVALRRRLPSADVAHLADWRRGAFRAAEDGDILEACFAEKKVFVTYDQRTVPGLLRRWGAEERPHAGVIFGDSESVPANAPGAVASALSALIDELSGTEMTNMIRYLQR